MMDQSHRADRTRTFLKAIIDYNHGAVQVDCTVKNISASGARLEVTSTVNLPSTFNLRIPHRGETTRCSLVWRDNNSVGVRFFEHRESASPAQAVRQPTDLESENIRLKRRVKELTLRLEALGQDPLVDERP